MEAVEYLYEAMDDAKRMLDMCRFMQAKAERRAISICKALARAEQAIGGRDEASMNLLSAELSELALTDEG